MTIDYESLRVSDETEHLPVHVERVKCGTREVFDEEHYRRWHVMGVEFEGRKCRYLIPLGLGEGESDEEKGLRIPVLAGSSGKGCLVQVRDGIEMVPIKVRNPDTGNIEDDEYERIIWKTLARDVHHPVLGKMVVVVEPSVIWLPTQDEEGKPKIVLQWEDEAGDIRVPGKDEDKSETRRRLLLILKDELLALEQELAHEEDDVLRASIERDIAAQRAAIREMELNAQDGRQETS